MPGRRSCLLLAAAATAACGPVETETVERLSATGEMIALSGGGAGAANACFSCHGLDGSGDGAGAPRLAGLDFGYLDRQLLAYADGRRSNASMEWVAHHLSPAERKRVAAYYAAMPFEPRPPGTVLPAPRLYRFGDAERGLPACAACHGVHGQGIGPANPALAGQPAPYLLHQIEQWRRGERRSDPLGAMLRISQRLTPSEAEKLVNYASQLPGKAPSPEYREASR